MREGADCCGSWGLLTYELHDSSEVEQYALLVIDLFGERLKEESSPLNSRLLGTMVPMGTEVALIVDDGGHVAEGRVSSGSSRRCFHRLKYQLRTIRH